MLKSLKVIWWNFVENSALSPQERSVINRGLRRMLEGGGGGGYANKKKCDLENCKGKTISVTACLFVVGVLFEHILVLPNFSE